MNEVKLTCHCGGVELDLHFRDGFGKMKRCNCSICSRRNAVMAFVGIGDLKIAKGLDLLSTYTFNTHTAKHYFCSNCGIYTHHHRRSNPLEYGVNVACIQNVRIEDYIGIPYSNGRDHPLDR